MGSSLPTRTLLPRTSFPGGFPGVTICACAGTAGTPLAPIPSPRWSRGGGCPVPGVPSLCPIPRLSSPGSGSPVPPVPTHPGGRAAPAAAAGAGRSGGPCPPAAAPREPAPSAGGGSGRKPTPFGGGSAAEEMPLAALGPGRRGRGGGEDGPPLPQRRRASVSLQRREGLRLRRGQGEGTGTRARNPQGRTGLELMSGGLDTGVLVGCTHPNYSRAAGSDGDGELPHSGHGEGAAPDIQPPLVPAGALARPHGSGWWLPHGCPGWWAVEALEHCCLPCLYPPLARAQLGLPGHPHLAGGLGVRRSLGTRGQG